MGEKYNFEFEIGGDLALFKQPEASPFHVSYPFPTLSAIEAWVKNCGFVYGAYPVIEKLQICRPVKMYRYHFQNTGIGRNIKNVKNGNADIHLAVCLQDVCYKVNGYFINDNKRLRTGAYRHVTTNPAHMYQCLFNRNMARGRWRVNPYLGWNEMVANYFGPLRQSEKVNCDLNMAVANMMVKTYDGFSGGNWQARREPFVEVINGEVNYAQFYR
jgi:CRISPR-associated protein Cas5d